MSHITHIVSASLVWLIACPATAAETEVELVLQRGLPPVWSMSLSHTGHRLLAHSMTEAVLFDTATGRMLRTFSVPGQHLKTALLNREGSRVLLAHGRRITLFDTIVGSEIQSFVSPSPSLCFAWSGDGSRLLTGDADQRTRLWNVRTAKCLKTFAKHNSKTEIHTVALNEDGSRSIAVSNDKVVFWDVDAGKALWTLDDERETISDIELSGDASVLLLSLGGRLELLSPKTGKPVREIKRKGFHHFSFASSDNGKVMLIAGATSLFFGGSFPMEMEKPRYFTLLCHKQDRQVEEQEIEEEQRVRAVAVSGDGEMGVTCYNNDTVVVWNVNTRQTLQTFKIDVDVVREVSLDYDGKVIQTSRLGTPHAWSFGPARNDGITLIWSRATEYQSPWWISTNGVFDSTSMSADGNHILALRHNRVDVWELSKMRLLRTLAPSRPALIPTKIWIQTRLVTSDQIESTAISGDGKLAFVGFRNMPSLWDVRTGKRLRTFDNIDKDSFHSASLNQDGSRLLLVGWESAKLFDCGTGTELRSFYGVPATTQLSRDGKSVLAGSHETGPILWDAENGKRVWFLNRELHNDRELWQGALNQDGSLVLTTIKDDRAILWDVATDRALYTFVPHSGSITALALSGDGKRALTAHDNGSNVLWNAKTGKEVCRLFSFDRGRAWLILAPDGRFDASASALRYVAFRKKGTLDFVPTEPLLSRYYRPGLGAELLQGER